MRLPALIHASAASTAEPAPLRKLVKAAQQFEGLLLNTLLTPMEKSFSSLPGQKDVAGADDYAAMSAQALAAAMSAAGGLGIARMIIHNVMIRHEVKSDPSNEVLPGFADKTRG